MNFFDLHCDTPTKIYGGMKECDTAAFSRNDFECHVQVKAIWIDDDINDGKNYFEDILRYCNEKNFINAVSDLSSLKNSCSSDILMIENASFLYENENYLYNMYNMGVRIISLTWNGENPLAGGALSNGNLTQYGREIISRAEEIGILTDLSHLNMQSAAYVVTLTQRPLATHSCCYEITPNLRNITDDILLKIKQKNGIIGLCFYPPFLGDGNVFINFEKNIRHLLNMGMGKCIAIGSDFDGAKMDKALASASDIPFLYRYLCKRGMEAIILDDIFYNNAIEFFASMCHNKSN